MKRPNSRRNLDAAIVRLAGSDEGYVAARTLIANALVGGMLPNGAVKGGSSLKLRFGDAPTRATDDLDAARASDLAGFVSDLSDSLSRGWEGFSGRLVAAEPARPRGVPAGYVMQPFDVRLSYLGKPWCTVRLELGHDEIGDADEPEPVEPAEANALLAAMGFPPLGPVPSMPLHYQVAQKLHGASEPGSARAHDLIDLQLIAARGGLDLALVRRTCERLFAYRGLQAWPPVITKGDNWDALYRDQLPGDGVAPTADEAVAWANDFIAKVCAS